MVGITLSSRHGLGELLLNSVSDTRSIRVCDEMLSPGNYVRLSWMELGRDRERTLERSVDWALERDFERNLKRTLERTLERVRRASAYISKTSISFVPK